MIYLYLDPGSGSFIIQLLIAGAAGLALAIGSSWAKIKRFFGGNTKISVLDLEDDLAQPPQSSGVQNFLHPSVETGRSMQLPQACPHCSAPLVNPSLTTPGGQATLCPSCGQLIPMQSSDASPDHG